MALIQDPILPQNFEIYRDQIALILADELSNQFVLQPTLEILNATIQVERFIPVDVSEMPLISVRFFNAETERDHQTAAQVKNTYVVDVFTKATFSEDESVRGDSQSFKDTSRLLGVIQRILKAPEYLTLGLTNGGVRRTNIEGWTPLDFQRNEDRESVASGRLVFEVYGTECRDPQNNVQEIVSCVTDFFVNSDNVVYRVEDANN